MREDILINVAPFETRVALLGNGALQEVHLQRASHTSVTGNIYLGRVQRVLPGMQAAFVEVGLARPGFLHARDVAGNDAEAPIEQLLREGDSVLVQVSKDPIASKGARLTTQLSIASRYLVFTPNSAHIGVSQRIEDETERSRLRELATSVGACVLPEGSGIIVRTAAEGASSQEFATDLGFLLHVWERIESTRNDRTPASLVYEDLPVHIQVVRDLVGSELESIRIDCPDTFERVKRFVDRFVPEFSDRVSLYTDRVPLFDAHGLEQEIDRALDVRVPLKCGGYLVIEQTEAMTTIDVNTGGNVGSRNAPGGLEETVYRTNLEAAAIVPRQLRLRNLGGIVVVDFIDMQDDEHRRHVLRVLEQALEQDRARTRVSGFSELGLVEISRKRTRESLARQLCQPCPACMGRGQLRTAESVCFQIFRDILRVAHRDAPPQVGASFVVRAAQGVIDRLLDEDAAFMQTLGAGINMPIRLQVEPCYATDQFDVVVVSDGGA